MAMETLSNQEWEQVRRGESEIGFAWIMPGQTQIAQPGDKERYEDQSGMTLDTGVLSQEQINLMLTHLPVDISFVDENDEVRYCSATKERIFPLSPGVIGRKVQNCHPPKSMPRVQEILNNFRSSLCDDVEFWIVTFFSRHISGDYKCTIHQKGDNLPGSGL